MDVPHDPPPLMRDLASEPYRRLAPGLFDRPLPVERRATCERCAMCAPDGEPHLAGRTSFRADLKCCTYHPALPNYVVGAFLADPSPAQAEGRRRVRTRIAAQHGVSPRGVDAPPGEWQLRRSAGNAFGRAGALRCPYLDDGRCTVRPVRDPVCFTYFCKHDRGAEAKRLYDAVRDYFQALGEAVGLHAMLRLGIEPARALAPPAGAATTEELDGLPLPEPVRRARWGRWAGKEEAFFLAAHEEASRVDASQAAALGGVALEARLRMVEAAYGALAQPRLPGRLRLNPALRVWREPAGGYLLSGYSRFDPVRAQEPLYGVLAAFDGRATEEVLAELQSAGRPFPSGPLLQKLYDHRVLVDAERGDPGPGPV